MARRSIRTVRPGLSNDAHSDLRRRRLIRIPCVAVISLLSRLEAASADDAACAIAQELITSQDLINNAENQTRTVAAIQACRELAESGKAWAQFSLAALYDSDGYILAFGFEDSLLWYRRSAEQGYAPAQRVLGWKYQFGDGVPEDQSEGNKWLLRAAEQGDPRAQGLVGTTYASGINGVPRDDVKAYFWMSLAVSGMERSADADREQVSNLSKLRDMIAKGMTAEQISEAQRLASEWKPKLSE